jgi:DNA-binding MarR family transcriptional regulator/ribosomal protein S18 acetylase RimI-like enzyme
MNKLTKSQILEIRAASRQLVRELGFMNQTIAGQALSPSAIHGIIEIGYNGKLSSRELSTRLILEKSTISRLIRSLVDSGIVLETQAPDDKRKKLLALTSVGEKTLAKIDKFASAQVSDAVSALKPDARALILYGLQKYADALRQVRCGEIETFNDNRFVFKSGYRAGVVGRIVEMQANYYSELTGFGWLFESTIAAGLAEFVSRVHKPKNFLCTVTLANRVVGSIVIDGEDLGDNIGHLRWFFLEEETRGKGFGNKLMRKAMEFCAANGFTEVHLWTFKGLDSARALYERYGFQLVEERSGKQWGKQVLEQRYVRLSK